jgi:N-terminal acetyltransferase A, auxiliary subunit
VCIFFSFVVVFTHSHSHSPTLSLSYSDVKDTAQTYLYDMQCLWYELELAESYYRSEQYARALRKFRCIERHCEQFSDDQWDFHTYYLRKVTLRAYVDMVQWASGLLSHPAYVQAMVGMARCYQRVAADEDRFLDLSMRKEIDPSTLKNAGERKRHQREFKKAQQRAAEELKAQMETRATRRVPHDLDSDPLGKELLHVDDLMVAAQARARSALESVCKAPVGSLSWEQQSAAFEVTFDIALRRGKHLLALQALNRAAAVRSSSEDPLVHRMLCAFVGAGKVSWCGVCEPLSRELGLFPSSLPPHTRLFLGVLLFLTFLFLPSCVVVVQKSAVGGVVRAVIDEELKKPSLLGAQDSIVQHSDKFVASALKSTDPLRLGAALRGAHLIGSATKDADTQSCLKALLVLAAQQTCIAPQRYAAVLTMIRADLSEEQSSPLLAACAKRFPTSSAFNPDLALPLDEEAPDYI